VEATEAWALVEPRNWLFAVNAGSEDLSVLAVGADGLALVDRAAAGGVRPTSVAVHGGLLYVVSTGGDGDAASLHGFRVGDDGRIAPREGSRRQRASPTPTSPRSGSAPMAAPWW
jgi:6-phosphogluconolactonase